VQPFLLKHLQSLGFRKTGPGASWQYITNLMVPKACGILWQSPVQVLTMLNVASLLQMIRNWCCWHYLAVCFQ